MYEYFRNNNSIYIITEYCQGGELFDRLVKSHHFSERKACEIMEQIVSAVVYCHERKIVHRDLKPENVLLESTDENSALKVIDFGTSTVFNKKMEKKLGTVSQKL